MIIRQGTLLVRAYPVLYTLYCIPSSLDTRDTLDTTLYSGYIQLYGICIITYTGEVGEVGEVRISLFFHTPGRILEESAFPVSAARDLTVGKQDYQSSGIYFPV